MDRLARSGKDMLCAGLSICVGAVEQFDSKEGEGIASTVDVREMVFTVDIVDGSVNVIVGAIGEMVKLVELTAGTSRSCELTSRTLGAESTRDRESD